MHTKETLQQLAKYLSQFYANVSIRRNKIIILEQSDPYILRLSDKKLITVRRWWDNIYLLAIVALIIYSLLELLLLVLGLHITHTLKFYSWTVLMAISTVFIARDNKCQKKIKQQIKEHALTFLQQRDKQHTTN